jgi:hypothetical protein
MSEPYPKANKTKFGRINNAHWRNLGHLLQLADLNSAVYERVSKSFRTDHLEREQQILQLSATRHSCIATVWVSLVSFAAITICVASKRVFIVVKLTLRYRLSPETFGYTLVHLVGIIGWPVMIVLNKTASGAYPASCQTGTGGGGRSPDVKRPKRDADYSLPSNAEAKDAWSYSSTPQYVFMAWYLVKHRNNFSFISSKNTK